MKEKALYLDPRFLCLPPLNLDAALSSKVVHDVPSLAALPLTMGGQKVTFYAVVVQAGKMPPVSSPSELTPPALYVIMMDKKTVTVGQ